METVQLHGGTDGPGPAFFRSGWRIRRGLARPDLVIVDGDPSKDLRVLGERDNIKAVIKDGEFVTCKLEPAPVSELA